MRNGFVWLLAVAITASGIASGCSNEATQQDPPTPSPPVSTPSPSQEPSPSQQAPQLAWQAAIEATEAADALLIDVQLITNVEGFERITAGIGYIEVDTGFGDIRWTDDLGSSREVITSSGHFLEIDGTWFALGDGSELPTTIAFDPLAALATATDVVDVGPEDVGGSPTVRLEADLSGTEAIETMGFSDEEKTVFEDSTDASFTATIWIDDDGRIVRIVREFNTSSFDGDPISATSLFLVEDAGEPRPIDVPETKDAVEAPV